MKKIKILNSNGKNIAAVIHYPKKPTDHLAILCPGYLDSKNYKHMTGLAETLSMQGYTAVRFDPTGTWESEGDINDYTTTQYLKDVKSVIDYMSKAGAYKFILLGGHSRGGMVSIIYAACNIEIFAVLAIMPSIPYSKADKRREQWQKIGFRISQRDTPNEDSKKEFRVPYSHIQDAGQYNVALEAKKVKVPIIFVAGALDVIAPPTDIRRIFNNANEPKEYILIEGIGHDYRHNPLEVKTVNNKVIEALSKI
ncbi:MAG: alpha/beta fold hydrolase [Patescibacteria group bacterium]